jgi:hypothetical protein
LPGGPVFVRVNYPFNGLAEPYRLYAVVQPPLAMAALEAEPNDLIGQANSDDRNYFYGTLAGPAPSSDSDVYSFAVSDGDLIYASLDGDPGRNGTPINAKMELLDEFGNVLITVNDSNASSNTNQESGFFSTSPNSPGEALVFRSPGEGTYYVRVSIGTSSTGPSGAGDYLLSISKNCAIGSLGTSHGPALSNVTVGSPVPQGSVTSLSGIVSDLDAGDKLTMVVTWGDGQTNTSNYPAGLFQFNLTHRYDIGPTNLMVQLNLWDSEGTFTSAAVPLTVAPMAPPRFIGFNYLAGSPNPQMHLDLLGASGLTYRVEKSSDLRAWSLLGEVVADETGHLEITDTLGEPTQQFYRAVSVQYLEPRRSPSVRVPQCRAFAPMSRRKCAPSKRTSSTAR